MNPTRQLDLQELRSLCGKRLTGLEGEYYVSPESETEEVPLTLNFHFEDGVIFRPQCASSGGVDFWEGAEVDTCLGEYGATVVKPLDVEAGAKLLSVEETSDGATLVFDRLTIELENIGDDLSIDSEPALVLTPHGES